MPEPFPVARPRVDATTLTLARRMFFEQGRAPAALVPGAIIDSWRRCLDRGLSVGQTPDITPVTVHELNAMLEQHEGLRRVCRPEMEALGAVASATQSILVLTDPLGFVLETIGDMRFGTRAAAVSLRPGTAWSEGNSGTNAIGAAILARSGVLVRGGEHYFEPHAILSCAATPIFDPRGAMIGVLDLTGPAAQAHPHTLGLVEMAVAQIEHRQFDHGFEGADVMILNRDPSLLGTAREGVLVFEGKRLVAGSRAGLACAGLDFSALGTLDYEDIFREKLARSPGDMTLRGRANGRLFARFRAHAPRVVAGFRPLAQGSDPVVDAALQEALQRACTWLSTGICVLVTGDSGVGKSTLCDMVHAALDPQAEVLRLNAAAQDAQTLAQALLTPEGALAPPPSTTLVLEEFGAMPLPLQNRLHSALAKEEPGTRRIIATSTQDIDAQRVAGTLRTDLLYALAQGRVSLPPLRARADLAQSLRAMIARQGGPAELDEAVMQALLAHDWPGNLRELAGVCRSMVALAGPGAPLTREHVPPHLLARSGEAPARASSGSDLNTLTLAAMQAALAEAGGNVSRAARKLGVDRTTLYRRLLWKERERGEA